MNTILKNILRQVLYCIPVSVVTGAVVAFFLWLLSLAIHFRFQHSWLLFLLPAAGVIIFFSYSLLGRYLEKGNNLVIEEIQRPAGGIPKRMGLVILFTTVITHLFGGSAGREGTAVQIGGSVASMFGKWFKLEARDTSVLLTTGIAAGFGAVFGTPFTGAIFALEVLTTGRMKYNALVPALAASIIADLTVSLLGIHHTAYHIDILAEHPYFLSVYLPADLILIAKVLAAAVAFGLAAVIFSFITHQVKDFSARIIRIKWLVPAVGGLIIIALTYLNGRQDYLSLGIAPQYPGAITIPSAFHAGAADTWSWLWKTIYTAVTLGTGFKGGEVTPLFYIGATLGNTLATLLNAPVSLFAALGFIAVFAAATNTPLACSMMGIELFGPEYALLFFIACFTAYFFSGHSGIYAAQQNPNTAITTGPKGYTYLKFDKYRLNYKSSKTGTSPKTAFKNSNH